MNCELRLPDLVWATTARFEEKSFLQFLDTLGRENEFQLETKNEINRKLNQKVEHNFEMFDPVKTIKS